MIVKSALLLFRDEIDGRGLLMVKEEEDSHWLLPGGRPNAQESMEEALTREIHEELSANVRDVSSLGLVHGVTVDGKPLVINLFVGSLMSDPIPGNEITEIRWMGRNDIPSVSPDLTPITIHEIFPFLSERGLW